MSTTEHSVLIALRELGGLEQQRRDHEAATATAALAAEARIREEADARVRADAETRAAADAARHAAETAERDRHEHALRLRAAEAEARFRGEQAARLHIVETEIETQLRSTRRQETTRQRLAGAAVIAALGLVGAFGAMLLTRAPAPTIVASNDDHLAALAEYSRVVDAMKQDVTRLRGENARNGALLDAAALFVATPPPSPTPTITKPRPIKPKPTTTDPGIKRPRITICQTDDPLAEDCPDPPKKK